MGQDGEQWANYLEQHSQDLRKYAIHSVHLKNKHYESKPVRVENTEYLTRACLSRSLY